MCPSFAYRAVDWDGVSSRGLVDAPDARSLVRRLEDRGLVVLDVREGARGETALAGLRGRFARRRQLVEATRAVASLLAAGLPLARAFGTAGGIAGGDVGDALVDAVRLIEGGHSVADALSRHGSIFSAAYVGVVRAGEQSGRLEEAFARLAELLERRAEIRSELISAFVYPAILAVFGLVATAILLLLVIPKFADLLLEAGATLPASTSFLLDLSRRASEWWLPITAVALVAPPVVARLHRVPSVRRTLSLGSLRIPVIESWRRHAIAAGFARTLGTLMGGGAPLVTALGNAERSVGDPTVRDEVARIAGRVREGAALHVAIGEGTIFPPLLGQLVTVGEESGELRAFLLRAAALFEERAERMARRLVALVEPLMILSFGGLIALVAFALLQAIYSVNSSAF